MPTGFCGSACPAVTARAAAEPDRGGPDRSRAAVAGVHLFTFNQVRQTEEWRAALLRRLAGPDPGGWLSDRSGEPGSVTHCRPRCVPSCLQNAAHTGLRRHRLSCATVSIDCNGRDEMSGCGWEQTVNSHTTATRSPGPTWPLRGRPSGVAAALRPGPAPG